MRITFEMLKRCSERNQKQEPTKEALEAAELSQRKAKDELGFEWEGLEVFWNWVGRLQASQVKGSQTKRPPRGLLICGPVGTGKTTLAKYLSCKFGMNLYSFQELDREYGNNPDGFANDYEFLYDHNTPVIIDDLGAEAGTKHYGNEPLARTLLLDLYNRWDLYGKLVIITTNLKTNEKYQSLADSVTSVFGERIQSRFCEMFETVKVIEKDRRRAG